MSLAEKTRKEVESCLDWEHGPTWRNLASAMGILQYASRTLGMNLAGYFAARRAIGAIGAFFMHRQYLWDSRMPPMCDAVMRSFRQWRDDILRAPPQMIYAEEAPSLSIVVDATSGGGARSALTATAVRCTMPSAGRRPTSAQESTSTARDNEIPPTDGLLGASSVETGHSFDVVGALAFSTEHGFHVSVRGRGPLYE